MYDVCIIGAGVVGMNIARELSRYKLRVCVLEKEADVSCGCSKANSGIVHGGYSDESGSLKAELCVAGNRLYQQLDAELCFGYRQTGSMVLAFREEDVAKLEKLYNQGLRNGVQGLSVISGEQAREMEPHLSREVKAALYCENAGVTSPYEFVIALAENAVENGVELRLNTEVTAIQPFDGWFTIVTSAGELVARTVVNAAGVYSDAIASMIGIDDFRITPRRGQYLLLDKDQNYLVKSVIFQVPTELGKGILVTTTYHGNLMIGPNAEDIGDKADVGTDEETIRRIVLAARKSVPGFDMKKALTSFAGNRPIANRTDFVIEASKVKGFINLIGIDSPGLTASPAIALKVVDILEMAGLELVKKSSFQPCRQPIIRKKSADFNGRIDSPDPENHIICRCEQVTEAEIIDSLHRGIPVQSLDAVKLRTRAGMGKCQGAFCGSRVRQLLARELNIPLEEVTQRGKRSSVLAQRAKRGDYMNL
ncbi:FAD/NAD(P)-binding oxidoreductase [Anaerosporomusa subterranea]|uniref:FAD/NAD(P)-binding oxidoreductase n=1 Tax=Anaerosporomusa subterranea TaxID=1794912 RepID=A0A154BTF2_ANASB|nr:NAD(P)/FAD-dependent oxidoreductase [Anaerosporomusa subterranea]KYZ76798.1 FAD/NAD(P)-binding oxidoreductase [Anaerosporomusa subterranea]